MINNYRTSFNNRHHSEALEYNLDHVVNQTQLKMKELINKKQEKIRENGQLKAQRGVLESDIAFYEREIKDKDEQLGKLSEEYYINQKEIEELEKEYSSALNDLNQQNENYKHTINFVNKDFDTMTVSNGIEETSKKSETKLEYESYMKVKSENKSLMDKLHDLRRELYFLEVSIFIRKLIFCVLNS
jgi:type VI protein secretion system component VasK